MICALSNFENVNMDIPTVICGNVVKNSLSETVVRIREINKAREQTEIVTLITKDEMLLYLVLKNVTEHKKNDSTILDHINSIDEFLENSQHLLNENFKIDKFNQNILLNAMDHRYDTLPLEDSYHMMHYKKELEKKLTFFFECLSNFARQRIRITYDIELFKMFAPILEVIRFELETGDDLSFFFDLEDFQENEALCRKYPNLRKEIKMANNFNKSIEKYSGTLINYLNNSKTKFEYDDILFITDNLTCFQSLFCNEKTCNEKLICLYDSIDDSIDGENRENRENRKKTISESEKYRYVVTNDDNEKNERATQVDNIIFLGKKSIFLVEENICQIINL